MELEVNTAYPMHSREEPFTLNANYLFIPRYPNPL